MAEVYANVDKLEGTTKVGTGQCVELIQRHTSVGQTGKWVEGATVQGNHELAKGTAIATFVDGKYESKKRGNHAAFYIKQDTNGIYVMDQWADNKEKPKVSMRYIRRKGKDASGRFVDPSNNADAYSVIER